MAKVQNSENEFSKHVASRYQEALDALSSLITKRSRADKSNLTDRFGLLFDYLKILELEEAIEPMKIIHVAGTKGKGSTCTFTESILRNCGFRTGLFTSPHLIDVRERFRLDGTEIGEEKYLAYFWWCYDRLTEKTNGKMPMLACFQDFCGRADAVILEVGLGGRFDATNVVKKPVVCGISSFGYDHMEILGNTLTKIAAQKAGIFKYGVPAFTVRQSHEAMHVLEEEASKLDMSLQKARPLDERLLNGQKLQLEGEHQYLNAGLAVALSSTWLQRTGHLGETDMNRRFINGLTTASLQGRAQIVSDGFINTEHPGDLVFYLDGAHSPESMEACGRWFSLTIKQELQKQTLKHPGQDCSEPLLDVEHKHNGKQNLKTSEQILLFNCMSVRGPQLLLPRLRATCANNGVHFKKVLFVPNMSEYHKVGSHSIPTNDSRIDLSWQFALQRLWENLMRGNKGEYTNNSIGKDDKEVTELGIRSCENSAVFSSLPLAMKWLREIVQQSRTAHFQVLVTGSLHLVGDVLRLIKK